ncbi:MAG TPA: YpdA family putative bacillithiol disulfide reductase [Saprospiraceae bacterium]|nr:YpdA family putative bacillithiol disulfide reductase [Saprospiraceae bacterium]
MSEKSTKILIIGAGPTGLNCAIEAQNQGMDYAVIEKGLLVNSLFYFPANMTFFSTSLNLEIGGVPFISHRDKPTRQEALEYYRRIAESFHLNIHYREKVLGIVGKEGDFRIETDKGNWKAEQVIVAIGYYDTPRLLNVPGEDLVKVKHYYDEAHHYIGQNVVVVGGANSACDVALETMQKGASVIMVVREPHLYHKVKYWILPNIENRIKEGSIKAYFKSIVTRITEDKVFILTPEGEQVIENDYVLAMTGYQPDYPFLEGLGIRFGQGKEKAPIYNPDTLESSIEGIYLGGVILSGLNTGTLFIENTRHHARQIMNDIRAKISTNTPASTVFIHQS